MAKKKTKKKAVKKNTKPVGKSGKKTVKKVVRKKTLSKSVKKAKVTPKIKTVTKVVEKIVKVFVPEPVKKTTSINPYLNFAGNCEEAFGFYKSVFGGDFSYLARFGEMPPAEGQPPLPESEKNKIMHISLPISKETTLMGSDSSEAFGHATNVGNNFSIYIDVLSKNEADRIFNSLAENGKITMPINETFWGSYFGMLVDKYEIQWMVSFDAAQN